MHGATFSLDCVSAWLPWRRREERARSGATSMSSHRPRLSGAAAARDGIAAAKPMCGKRPNLLEASATGCFPARREARSVAQCHAAELAGRRGGGVQRYASGATIKCEVNTSKKTCSPPSRTA